MRFEIRVFAGMWRSALQHVLAAVKAIRAGRQPVPGHAHHFLWGEGTCVLQNVNAALGYGRSRRALHKSRTVLYIWPFRFLVPGHFRLLGLKTDPKEKGLETYPSRSCSRPLLLSRGT